MFVKFSVLPSLARGLARLNLKFDALSLGGCRASRPYARASGIYNAKWCFALSSRLGRDQAKTNTEITQPQPKLGFTKLKYSGLLRIR